MAIVKGLLIPGRMKTDNVGLLVSSPPYAYTYSPTYEKPPSSQTFEIRLGGGNLVLSFPTTPMVPGGNAFTIQPVKPYETKFTNKYISTGALTQLPVVFPISPGSNSLTLKPIAPYESKFLDKYQKLPFGNGPTAYADQIDDSVTTSDSLTFDRLLTLSDNPAIADAQNFDIAMQINDSVSLADNVVEDQIIIPPIHPMYPQGSAWITSPLKPYEASQVTPSMPSILFGPSVNNYQVNVNDSFLVSDNVNARNFPPIPQIPMTPGTLTVGSQFTLQPLKPYEAKQFSPTFPMLISGLVAGVAPGVFPPYILTVGGNFTVIAKNPPSYERKQIIGPFGMLLGALNYTIFTPVNYTRTADDAATTDDFVVLERHPNVDDDILSITDFITVTNTKLQLISDSVSLSDFVDTVTTAGIILTQNLTEIILLEDSISLSVGTVVPHVPGYVAPSQQGPYMDIT